MPRPSIEQEVRQAVDAYITAALTKSVEEAPLNVLAVAHQTGFNRKSLKKYRLDVEIGSKTTGPEWQGIATRDLSTISS
jgi:hypothetical protein